MSYIGKGIPDFITDFREPPSFSDPSKFKALMLEVVALGISDTIIQTREPVLAALHGRLRPLSNRRLPAPEVAQILKWAIGRDGAGSDLAKGRPVRGAYVLPDPDKKDARGEAMRHRFRVNATRIEKYGSDGIQIVMRTIPNEIPTIEKVGFDKALLPFMTPKDGIIYISGPTGVGKSSTFAALIRYILENDTPIQGNIITLEDPIEFVFDYIDSVHSIVAPSQVGRSLDEEERGRDIATFAEGVRDAMRRWPALLMIGEMRDWEAAAAGIEASNTGHPVYTTVHSNDVATIPERLLSTCPKERRDAALFALIDTGRVLINQALAFTVDGKRTPLREHLVITDAIREEIQAVANPSKITSVMREMVRRYGRTMTQAASEAYELGLIPDSERRKYSVR